MQNDRNNEIKKERKNARGNTENERHKDRTDKRGQ